jgi:hypothetical protein
MTRAARVYQIPERIQRKATFRRFIRPAADLIGYSRGILDQRVEPSSLTPRPSPAIGVEHHLDEARSDSRSLALIETK